MTINDYRKEYFKQKEIEQIVLNRKLIRPKTNYFLVAIYVFVFALICALIGVSIFFIPISFYYKIIIYIVAYLLFLEFYLRFLLIQFVKCYQHYAKEETRRRCLCVPSCSEYAIIALKKYELIHALLLIHHRLFKVCLGEKYIIDYP